MTPARTASASIAIVAAVVLLVGIAVTAVLVTRDDWTEPEPIATTAAPSGLANFYGQKLSWTSCDAGRCAWVKVPIDYDRPGGATTRLRVAVHPATDGPAKRSILVNPGGPGGSAIEFAEAMSTSFGKDVRQRFDIVGVDPRGVGQSTPLRCLSDQAFDDYIRIDPDPDNPAEITALRQSMVTMGRSCLKHSGELARHVSTVEVAKDMDVVRALLGRAKLDWFGASYGTELGAVYAELFPDNVGRMVLDGAVDPSLGAADSSLGQAIGFQRAIDAYARDCVSRPGCPLGDDASAGLAKVRDLMDRLDASPMKGLGDRDLTEGHAFFGIAVTLYDKTTWPLLSQALSAAFSGDGSVLLRLSDAYFRRTTDGSYASNIGQVITAVNCLDNREQLTQQQVEALIPRFQKVSPVFGRPLAWGALACTDWPIKATSPLPTINAEGAAPILVLGTTRDPATPYEWAQALASQLDSAVLVTREGDGHTAYTSGNGCIADVVDDYFVNGTVPKEGLTCR